MSHIFYFSIYHKYLFIFIQQQQGWRFVTVSWLWHFCSCDSVPMDLVIINKSYPCGFYLELRDIASSAKYQTFSKCLQHARHRGRHCGQIQNKRCNSFFEMRVKLNPDIITMCLIQYKQLISIDFWRLNHKKKHLRKSELKTIGQSIFWEDQSLYYGVLSNCIDSGTLSMGV